VEKELVCEGASLLRGAFCLTLGGLSGVLEAVATKTQPAAMKKSGSGQQRNRSRSTTTPNKGTTGAKPRPGSSRTER